MSDYKFLQLTSDQVSIYWPLIRKAIEESHPPVSTIHLDFFNAILQDILMDRKQVWMATKDDNEPVAVCVTSKTLDIEGGHIHLLIYALYTTAQASKDLWFYAMKILREYAKFIHADKIIAYTTVPEIVTLSEKLGFTTEWRYLEMEV